MVFRRARLLSQPGIVMTILKNIGTLDPTVLFGNPYIYYVTKHTNRIAFVVVKKHRTFYELKSVYTFAKYRHTGEMRRLIKYVRKRYPSLTLLCAVRLAPFYARLGFMRVRFPPRVLRIKQKFYNIFVRKTSARRLVILSTTQ